MEATLTSTAQNILHHVFNPSTQVSCGSFDCCGHIILTFKFQHSLCVARVCEIHVELFKSAHLLRYFQFSRIVPSPGQTFMWCVCCEADLQGSTCGVCIFRGRSSKLYNRLDCVYLLGAGAALEMIALIWLPVTRRERTWCTILSGELRRSGTPLPVKCRNQWALTEVVAHT